MKILALYLPQFHRVPENDEWWGEGFTEWTAVKNALPRFEGHYQPRVPENNDYYDLTQKQTFLKQVAQVKKSGIDGICMYHYWFKDGRKILEKPAELLLGWDDVALPFCFSWANETWARTWSNLINQNVWSSLYSFKTSKEQDVLLDQRYGGYQDWREHFMYLLPFFKDNRYIKIDGKPVFVFHRPDDIACLPNMIDCWRELALQNGLQGIFFVGNTSKESQLDVLDELFVSEPAEAMQRCEADVRGEVRCFDYSVLWNGIRRRKLKKRMSLCAFVGYDDTPRHGKKGTVVYGASPHQFEEGMLDLIRLNRHNECRIMFINAWNEWGEGMYLEPDTQYGDEYICSLNRAIEISQIDDSKEVNCNTYDKAIDLKFYESIDKKYDRERHINRILDGWLKIREEGINVCSYIEGKTVALYGYGLLGKHFLKEMEKQNIFPVFVVDRNSDVFCEYPVFKIDEDWPDVDILVVTATYDYGSIFTYVKSKYRDMEIVSLENIILGMC